MRPSSRCRFTGITLWSNKLASWCALCSYLWQRSKTREPSSIFVQVIVELCGEKKRLARVVQYVGMQRLGSGARASVEAFVPRHFYVCRWALNGIILALRS